MRDPDNTQIRRLKPGTRFECHDPMTGELFAKGHVEYVTEGRVYVHLDKERVVNFEARDGKRVQFVRPGEGTSWAPETLVTPCKPADDVNDAC